MIAISYEAKALIADDDRYPSDQPLRLVVDEDDSFELRPSAPTEEDLTFSHYGRTLVLVESDLALRLDGKELAAERTPEGKRLVLQSRTN